ncbi:hypothetical protein B0H34DRAFT_783979 [Crassisporium funariophilum]|nr:hypothetical protein B0H34DRAFT_783979 [Crassisporium funariophilum]
MNVTWSAEFSEEHLVADNAVRNSHAQSVPLVGHYCLSAAGYAMYLALESKFASYAALYLMVPGIYAASPVAAAWMANNSEPHYRRATSIALGFVASNTTTILNLSFNIISIALVIVSYFLLSWMNKRKQRQRAALIAPYANEKEADGGVNAWIELGDRHPDFRYIL